MKLFDRLDRYLEDNDYKVTISKGMIHIINYLQILSIEDERVAFLTNKGRIIIKGNNLCLNKLLDDEVLVSGFVSNIEVDFND